MDCLAGSTAAGQLSNSQLGWVADKREAFQALMGSSAGIIRRQADMKAGLDAMAPLASEIQARCLGQHPAWPGLAWPALRSVLPC